MHNAISIRPIFLTWRLLLSAATASTLLRYGFLKLSAVKCRFRRRDEHIVNSFAQSVVSYIGYTNIITVSVVLLLVR